jgi:hypothetical protein
MIYYIRFALRFFFSYYLHATYNYYGNLPFQAVPGTVATIIAGGSFKYLEKYVYTRFKGWVLFESTEELVKNSKEYKDAQEQIKKDLQALRETVSEDTSLPKYLN